MSEFGVGDLKNKTEKSNQKWRVRIAANFERTKQNLVNLRKFEVKNENLAEKLG